jgi:hypothetical protein
MLAGFAAVMVAVLMLDDPADKLARLSQANAMLQAERPLSLFPQVTASAQIEGLEVLDVTGATGLLLVRNEQFLWYAPAIPGGQDEIGAERINQGLAEQAAASLLLMATRQWYDATPSNFEVFGLKPDPRYRFRFWGRDAAGQTYESVILEIGDANPDHVAYYVWPQGDQRIYLIGREVVDLLLNMLTESIQTTATPETTPMDDGVTTPVP